ncbi:PfkB family carbohydrate kinase [Dactylosporangium sp. AC04546]|uniref:PfkB family carbohydrate kinase n=1 Tax=Dactylosporangium sp. AC04546 TaxID=2862460 RepID=UPI001EDFB1C2|nr:PfkB family carbohydrate kinase [Dactylosporangium sp. AC04546]WVK79800.1 PfkB family carbohydrate kinase [Dactylosporangium sp. AC04546]
MTVLVIGEALVDVIDGRRRPGGSPMNVAIGLGRLGVPTVLHTRLGDDEDGQLLETHVRASGVALTPQSRGTAPTSVAEVSIDGTGSPAYRFAITWDPEPVDVAAGRYRAVHVGSISAMMRPGTSVLDAVLAASRASALLTYDLNVRPAIMGAPGPARARAEQVIACVDVVKASDEDIAWLYPGRPADQVFERWLAAGAKLAVLTRGARGARAATAATAIEVTAADVPVRDTVGAGDSFMAGMLAALDDAGLLTAAGRRGLPALDREDLRSVIDLGMRCAAVTVTREGADPPWRADLR